MILKSFFSPLCNAVVYATKAGGTHSFRGLLIPTAPRLLPPCPSPFVHSKLSSSQRFLTAESREGGSDVDAIPQPIVGYHLDEFDDWVAELECGHYQHVRHNPPMVERPWVLTEEGRNKFMGHPLMCKKCAQGEPRDDGK